MLRDRDFYKYYTGDIDVYSNVSQFNGVELAKSSLKRMALYYFNYALLPQLKAQAISIKYNLDSSINRGDATVELIRAASEQIGTAVALLALQKGPKEFLKNYAEGTIISQAVELAERDYTGSLDYNDVLMYTAQEHAKLIAACGEGFCNRR